MPKSVRMRLSAVGIRAEKRPGYHADGEGLYLQVSPTGSKSWVFRYMLNKRAREMGLGTIGTFSLAEARERARKYRQLLADGIDPIEHRKAEREKNLAAIATRRTFEECAHEYHRLHADGWKNAKHASQWVNTLTAYAFPEFGKKDISDVNKADILRALEPIWTEKAETAVRVRQRIRAVLDWAAARDYRRGHDTHIWDQLSVSLPAQKKGKHHAACPYSRIYEALQSIKQSNAGDTIKHAFEFIILTAGRSGEVRGAKWSEIDFENRRWIIPAERMKAAKEHHVPLTPRALAILKAQEGKHGELIFANDKGTQYSDMTFTMALRRLGHEFTVHGFRSTFRDWAGETTAFPREVIEHALAHQLKDKAEAAYARGTLFEKRRQLMEAWATYCATEKKAGDVIGIREKKK
jgi:integrase